MPATINEGYSKTTLALFMLLPFALAAIILYFSIKFCIMRYRGMVPDTLPEESPAQSKEGL
jgi:hypothetical protein